MNATQLLAAAGMPPDDVKAWGRAFRHAQEQGPAGNVKIMVDAKMVLSLTAALRAPTVTPTAPVVAPDNVSIF